MPMSLQSCADKLLRIMGICKTLKGIRHHRIMSLYALAILRKQSC